MSDTEEKKVPVSTKIGGTEYHIAGTLAMKKEDFVAMHRHLKGAGDAYDKIKAEFGSKTLAKTPQS